MHQAKTWKNWGCLSVVLGVLFCAAQAQAFVLQDRISLSKGLAHYAMGQVYDLLGEHQYANLEYQKSAQFDEANYLVHLRLGASYARLNMIDEAKEELQLVQQYNPEDLQSHYLLALIFSTTHEYEKAANEYEFILKEFSAAEPQNIEIYGYLGQLYYSQRKFDEAILQFEKILSLEPENVDIMYLLGSLYLDVSRKDDAVKILRQSLSIDPDHDGSLNTLAYLYAENGENLDEAMKLIQRALELSPKNGAYLDSLGWIYYQQGQYALALETFLKADALMKDFVIYDHIADTYYKLNNIDQALRYWSLSLDVYPDQEKVKEKINRVKNSEAKFSPQKK